MKNVTIKERKINKNENITKQIKGNKLHAKT